MLMLTLEGGTDGSGVDLKASGIYLHVQCKNNNNNNRVTKAKSSII